MRANFGEHAIDFWTPLAAADGSPLPEYGLGDGIHPNAEGQRLLFEQVKAERIPEALDAAPCSAVGAHRCWAVAPRDEDL